MTEEERLQLKLGSLTFERSDKERALAMMKNKRVRSMLRREIARLMNEEEIIQEQIDILTQP
jgi:hypothetical protein